MTKSRIVTFAIIGIAIVYWVYNYYGVNFKEDTASGIQFHRGTWDEALQLAKKENKLIFLDVYATWCGPCKKLKKTTFSDKEVGKLFNNTFINVSLDAEQGEGGVLAQKYQIEAYPTLLFIDAEGKVVKGASGYRNPKELIELSFESNLF